MMLGLGLLELLDEAARALRKLFLARFLRRPRCRPWADSAHFSGGLHLGHYQVGESAGAFVKHFIMALDLVQLVK